MGVKNIYRIFCSKVAEKKKLLHLTNGDIAKKTGYTTSAINSFMCGARESEQIARAIAAVLEIEL